MIAPHIEHSRGFLEAWNTYRSAPPTSLLDLGSGGGIPGLVLAEAWACPTVLLDAMEKRCRSLREYLAYEGAPQAVRVVCGRAEELARDRDLERSSELLVMRSFGPPSAAAECAARFVATGGLIIVSEPPLEESELRWDAEGLNTLGLRLLGAVTTSHRFVVIEKVAETSELYPRRNGLPTKRPLWA